MQEIFATGVLKFVEKYTETHHVQREIAQKVVQWQIYLAFYTDRAYLID
jgi:hypothetical protein